VRAMLTTCICSISVRCALLWVRSFQETFWETCEPEMYLHVHHRLSP
jgi:hypothetical protein